MQNQISAIVAMAENRVIGKDNQLPWRLPADLKHFKALTTGHPILMGRKTYQSIGRPLPNRTNLILTRDPLFQVNGCITVASVEAALQSLRSSDESFVIGGAEVYRLLMPYVTRIYLTIVHQTIAGDTTFPDLDDAAWKEVAREDHHADAENAYAYSFVTLVKK
jgi:dihydrofolate reductase